MGSVALWPVGTSLTRDWTRVSRISRWILYYWTTSEAWSVSLNFLQHFFFFFHMKFSTLDKSLESDFNGGKAPMNSFVTGSVPRLAHCNGRLFWKLSQLSNWLTCFHLAHFYEEKLRCWEQVLPNRGTMEKIFYFLIKRPENAACSILEKVMWCSFQHCLVYSWLCILFICVKPGSFKKIF